MLLTEHSLEQAIKMFLREAKLPVPKEWNTRKQRLYINMILVPAFYKALQEIEKVWPCHGFDLKNVYKMDEEGELNASGRKE